MPLNSTRYPIYVISKGRWESRLTVKALEARHIPYSIVIEPQEHDQYAAVIDPARILVLPFSNLGQGSIPARNWVWEHSIAQGAKRHWILDDNIRYFYRLTGNIKYRTTDAATFAVIEDCVDRYLNVALAGMQYEMFVPRKKKWPPVLINTRIYSCILIKNDLIYRWRGRYNEDTDLSLRCLKDGWCTLLFNAFPCDKTATLTMDGGNTDELYQGNGRLEMARSLQRQHPEIVKIVWKYHRWQHLVDYTPFKANALRLRDDIIPPSGVDNFGMKLTYEPGRKRVNSIQQRGSGAPEMDT